MSKKKIIGGSTQSTRLSDSNGPNLNKIQNWIDKASRLNQLKLRQFQEGDNPQQKNEENDLFEIQAFSEEEEEKHKSKPMKIKYKQSLKTEGKKKIMRNNYETSLNDKFFKNPVVSREMAFDELAFFINMETNIIAHLQQTHQKVEELRKVCAKFK